MTTQDGSALPLRPALAPIPDNPDQKGEILRAAQMAELLYRPKSREAIALTRTLTDELMQIELKTGKRSRRRTIEEEKRLLASLSAFWSDLMIHSNNEAALGCCYHPTNQDDYANNLAARRQLEAVIEVWEDHGLVEFFVGFSPLDDFDGEAYRRRGFARRVRATERLVNLTKRSGVEPAYIQDHIEYAHRASFPIEAKTCDGKKATFKPKALSDQAEPIWLLNEFLDQQTYSFPTKPRLRRLFHMADDPAFSWNKGGRIYAVGPDNFQTLPSSERNLITVNGEETAELDISASHLTIFLGLNGELNEVSSDLYSLDGYSRAAVKQVITAAFGKGEMPTRWPRGAKKGIAEVDGIDVSEVPKIGEVVNAILAKYPALSQLEETDLDWSVLQYHESEAFLSVMLCLMNEHTVPSLPVHDSLIVPQSKKELTRSLLQQAYVTQCNVLPAMTY
ncbi:hypothetical protein [Sulfitobacter sp. DSM 110093]|uniref:hypothetical protein n=1 Tax=Sulfitobacter sp. DSM 110093 TaxID=2883127 RepID=UPI001FADD05B|nr:hypothetical protein [Sulfitobacter sp. DSM 110093]